jgi:hypothetical protein
VSFASALRYLVPSWLLGPATQGLANMLDDATARVRAGLEARFPSRADDDALALIGAERGIKRGKTENRKSYAKRLTRWRYPFGHRVRGSAYGLLDQIRSYFGGFYEDGVAFSAMYAYSIDAHGSRFQIKPTGDLQTDYGFGWDWDGAGTYPQWARFWIVLDVIPGVTAGPKIGDPALWGGACGPGSRVYTVGQSGVTPDDIAAIRDLVLGDVQWKPAGTRAEWVIVRFSGAGFPSPTGNWQNQINRNTAYRYWSLLQ